MTTLAQTIHMLLSDEAILQQIQSGALHLVSAALSHEEREALQGLSHMLAITPHDLVSLAQVAAEPPWANS